MKSGFERIGVDTSLNVASRSCLEKKRYPTRNEARDRATKISKNDGRECNTYKCTICHGFHVTSAKKQSFSGIRNRNRRP